MNKIAVAILVLMVAVIFGLVFLKQINDNQQALADYFYRSNSSYSPNVAGSSINYPRNVRNDTSDQLDKDVDGLNLTDWEAANNQLEAQINGL